MSFIKNLEANELIVISWHELKKKLEIDEKMLIYLLLLL